MRTTTSAFSILAIALLAASQGKKPRDLGYQDTPLIPGSKWHVHDGKRPQPRIVTPGKAGSAPSDATVLFDGTNLDAWTGRGGKASWKVENGYMEVNHTGSIETRAKFGSCQLHLEFMTPKPPKGRGQGRGNSGVYIMKRYEVQILDCYDNQTYPDGQTAALYGQCPPLVNACRAPGEWQTYDIVFEAPRFDGTGKLVSPAYATVLHNGIVVHNRKALNGPTGHKKVAGYRAHGDAPLQLQDHGNPVRFRNVWLRKLTTYDSTR